MESYTIYDKNGEADLSFHGIPLHTLQKASFKNKIGNVFTLLKIIINGITYDISETSQNGAVLFDPSTGRIEFVAPVDRHLMSYFDMDYVTSGLHNMGLRLTEKPIPAWDTFIAWLNSAIDLDSIDSALTRCLVTTLNEVDPETYDISSISLANLRDSVDFVNRLESAFASSYQYGNVYMLDNGYALGFRITLEVTDENGDTDSLNLTFVFREC